MPSDLLKYHQWCISDPVAMPGYNEAIKRIVKPGDVVFDLGAGAGILGMLACAAGAAKVYAVDPSEIIALLPEIAAANGFADRIIVRQKLSYDFDPPERADVVIASMQGTAGIGNDLPAVVMDARQRLLKPGGTMVPLAIQPAFSPVEIPEWYRSSIDCWNQPRLGFSFQPARATAVNRTASFAVDEASLLAAPQPFPEIRFDSIASANVAAELSFVVERDGLLHALAGWVTLTMAGGIQCGSSPLDGNRMPWDHLLLPLESPTPVQAGDRIEAAIRVAMVGKQPITTWDVRVCGRAEFHQSSFRGMLLSKNDLAKRAATSMPVLSARGEAERDVLALCDGLRSIDQIAAETLARHPSVLSSLKEARAFALEVFGRPNTVGGESRYAPQQV